MVVEFIGPASLLPDGSVQYPAKLDGKDLLCRFTYEALEDVDSEDLQGDALLTFTKHQLKLLSIAEQKILNGNVSTNQVQIFSHDLSLG
jgi:hypothetical protein